MKNKIAIIGDLDSILAFKTLGMDIIPVSSTPAACASLDKAANEGYAIIYITEQYAAKMPEDIAQYREKKIPAIVPVPSIMGNEKIGMNQLKESVKKAVGIDILGFDE